MKLLHYLAAPTLLAVLDTTGTVVSEVPCSHPSAGYHICVHGSSQRTTGSDHGKHLQ